MEEERSVSVEEGQKFAEDHKLLFIETSAKTSVNVEEAFIKTSKIIYDKYLKGLISISSNDKGLYSKYRLHNSPAPKVC